MATTDNTDAFTKKIDLCFEEKSRLEEHFKYIVKVYMTLLAAYFAYTTFAVNTMATKHDKSVPIVVQFDSKKMEQGRLVGYDEVKKENNEDGYGKVLYSVFGLTFAVITVMYGWYAVMGIAHIVKKRAHYTNEIIETGKELATFTSSNVVFKPYDSDLIKQFKKVPVIYTFSALILVFSSYLYFFFIFDGGVEKAVLSATLVSIAAIAYVPSINVQFYEHLHSVNEKYSNASPLSPDKRLVNALGFMIGILLLMEFLFANFYQYLKYWFMVMFAIFIFLVISINISERTSKRGWFYEKAIIRVSPLAAYLAIGAEVVVIAVAIYLKFW